VPQDQHHDTEVDLELNFFYPYWLRLQARVAEVYLMMNVDQQGIFDSILALCLEPSAIFVNDSAG
jgi:hypothetical protein